MRSNICDRVDNLAVCSADNTAPRAVIRFSENDESSSTSVNHRTWSTYARTKVSISDLISSSDSAFCQHINATLAAKRCRSQVKWPTNASSKSLTSKISTPEPSM